MGQPWISEQIHGFLYTLTKRLEIIRQQKENAYRQMAKFQKKIDHLEWKEQHYMELIQNGAEDDCDSIQHKEE